MQKAHRKTVAILTLSTVLMFGFSFALVPLYRVACKKIGLNTSIPINNYPDLAAGVSDSKVVFSRDLGVQFIAMTNHGLAWDFYPKTKVVKIHLRKKELKSYFMPKIYEKRYDSSGGAQHDAD